MKAVMETTKPRQTRRRLNEQTWRALMKKFDGARMTPQEFCEGEGLSRKSFARWRSRLVLAPRRASSAVPAPTATCSLQSYFHLPLQQVVADRLRPDGRHDFSGVKQASGQIRSGYSLIAP
jgi:hypothetical protein